MSYNVKTTAGTTLVVIPDRHIDRDTTSLALLGFNTTQYGLDHAENFVHLLEHFANDVAPDNPIKGQLWFDTGSNTMKVYHDGLWASLSGTPSIGVEPTLGGVSGIYHCPVSDTSVAIIFAGGNIVAVMACRDIDLSLLPESVTIDGEDYTFRAMFPFGLQGGVNLADPATTGTDDPADYVFSGRVPVAEQAHFSGGGVSDAEVSGWGFIDFGAGKSVGLMISCGQVIAAVSSAIVLWSDLPNTTSVIVNKNHQDDPVIINVRSRFSKKLYKKWTVATDGTPTFNPSENITDVALFPGITFADTTVGDNGINQIINPLLASSVSTLGTAIATASDALKVWVDTHSATALKLTDLESTFTTATGTSTIAGAVQSLIAMATDTSATTSAITDLKAQFTSALGTSSFGAALTKLSTTATATGSNSQAITDIKSTFENASGQTFTEAVSNLFTTTDDSTAGWSLSLNSNGYVTGVEEINGGAANNYFKVISSAFIIGDNNIDFVPFEVRNGVVYIKNAAIENLTISSDKITPGLSDVIRFTYADVYVGARYVENVIIETPSFSIGDGNGGKAMAQICYMQDGRFNKDSGTDVRVYVDIGDGRGYVLYRYNPQQGFRVDGGDITYSIPVMFPVVFSSTNQCRIKVTSECVKMPGQSDYNYSYTRNTEINVFKISR